MPNGNSIAENNLPIVTRPNYVFVGWQPSNGHINITENRTLTAQWTRTFTVTFNLNGGTHNDSVPLVQTIQYGQNAILPGVTSPEGFEFYSWSAYHTNITQNLVITANWRAQPQVLLINNPYANEATLSGTRLVQEDVTVTAGSRTSMQVSHWTVSPSYFASEIDQDITTSVTTITFTMPTHSVELIPHWDYTPVVLEVAGGNITSPPSTLYPYFHYGEAVTIEENATHGTQFTRWEFNQILDNGNIQPIIPNFTNSTNANSPTVSFTMPPHALLVGSVSRAGVSLIYGEEGASHNLANTYYDIGHQVLIDVGTRHSYVLNGITVYPANFTNSITYGTRFISFIMPAHPVLITTQWSQVEDSNAEILLQFEGQSPGNVHLLNNPSTSSPVAVSLGETLQLIATNGNNARLSAWKVNGITQPTNGYILNLTLSQDLVQQNNTIEVLAIFENISPDSGGSSPGNNGGGTVGGDSTANNSVNRQSMPAVPINPTPPNNFIPSITPSLSLSNINLSNLENITNPQLGLSLLANAYEGVMLDTSLAVSNYLQSGTPNYDFLLLVTRIAYHPGSLNIYNESENNNVNPVISNALSAVTNLGAVSTNVGPATTTIDPLAIDATIIPSSNELPQSDPLHYISYTAVPLAQISTFIDSPLIIPIVLLSVIGTAMYFLLGKRRIVTVVDIHDNSNTFSFKLPRYKKIEIPPSFTKDGYAIKSFFLNETMSKDQEISLSDYKAKGNVTLYVNWQEVI